MYSLILTSVFYSECMENCLVDKFENLAFIVLITQFFNLIEKLVKAHLSLK